MGFDNTIASVVFAHRLFAERLHFCFRDEGGIWVVENFAFVVAEGDFGFVGIYDIVRVDRDFSAAAGAINDELWDSVSGGVAAEFLDDIDAFCDGSAEVRGAGDEIALIEIIRFHAAHE